MDIQIKNGQEPQVVLRADEKRGLWSTVKILKDINRYLEEPFNPDNPDEFHGTAGLLLSDGFEQFVKHYAGEENK